MHFNCLFIVKAEDKSEAESEVENFLESYNQTEYDYYVIWWRWENVIPWSVAPLSQCMETVKEYSSYHKEKTIEAYNSMQEQLQKHTDQVESIKTWHLDMAWYYAIEWGNLVCDYFFNECLLYDIEYWWADHIPEDPTWYYVVSVDMHN